MEIGYLGENKLEFSEKTKRNLEQSKKDLVEGKTISLDEVKRKLGF